MPPETRILPASTVLLLRDVPHGLEVFMVVRHHQIDFAAGAMVFPGGKLHADDREPEVRRRCDGAETLDDNGLAFRVAALREAFEECGVLLARPEGAQGVVSAGEALALEADRRRLEKGEVTIANFLARTRLRLACDLLVPFAHWITPVVVPKRFDTHFFLAAAPADQVAAHDGGESVDSVWIRPQEALAAADRGDRTIIFPTRLNLMKLAESGNVAEAFERARRMPIVTVLPEVDTSTGTPRLRIPADAGYAITEAPLEALTGR
jgi:8-oxo-dGTP pyrophosphatase MutT (NUDIX family)